MQGLACDANLFTPRPIAITKEKANSVHESVKDRANPVGFRWKVVHKKKEIRRDECKKPGSKGIHDHDEKGVFCSNQYSSCNPGDGIKYKVNPNKNETELKAVYKLSFCSRIHAVIQE